MFLSRLTPDGHTTRVQMQAELDRVANRMNLLLVEGAILGDDKTVAKFCENLINLD